MEFDTEDSIFNFRISLLTQFLISRNELQKWKCIYKKIVQMNLKPKFSSLDWQKKNRRMWQLKVFHLSSFPNIRDCKRESWKECFQISISKLCNKRKPIKATQINSIQDYKHAIHWAQENSLFKCPINSLSLF